MIRCVNCGSSRLDAQGMGCALCGGSPAVPWERVHVSEETKKKLKAHAEELKQFGITVEDSDQSLGKGAGTVMTAIDLAINVVNTLRPGMLQKLVVFLYKNLRIPRQEILQLRLDEPENISEALKPQRAAKKKSTAKKATTVKKTAAKKTLKKH